MAWLWPIGHLYWRPVFRPPELVCVKQPVRTLKRLLSCLQYGFILILLILLILWIGREFEERAVNRSPSTLDIYTKPQVCGLKLPQDVFINATSTTTSRHGRGRTSSGAHHHDDRRLDGEEEAQDDHDHDWLTTYPNETVARYQQNTIIAHCGDCGACSNPHDVLIYDETKETLTDTTFGCAKKGIVGGRRKSTACMQENVGLSEECTQCWIDNIFCTLGKCFFTCVWQRLTNLADKSQGGQLNKCTKCDEQRCGRKFIDCAGANRRRVGILSDIDRDEGQEVCSKTQKEWWRNEQVQLWWESIMETNTSREDDRGDRMLRRRP